MPGRKKLTKQQKAFLKMAKLSSMMRNLTIPEYVLKITELHFTMLVMIYWVRVTDVIDDAEMYQTMFPRFVDICSVGWELGIRAQTEGRARMMALTDYDEDDPELDIALAAYKLKLGLFPDDKVIVTEADGDYNDGHPLIRLKFDTELLESALVNGEAELPKEEELADAIAMTAAIISGKTTEEQKMALAALEQMAEDGEGCENSGEGQDS